MLKLAEELAELLHTQILAHRIEDNEIIFVLASGPKQRMTEAQLQEAIKALQPKANEPETPDKPAVSKSKKKGV